MQLQLANRDSLREEREQLLQKLNRSRGITIVLITHEADIAAYATRQIRFHDGRIVEDVATSAGPA